MCDKKKKAEVKKTSHKYADIMWCVVCSLPLLKYNDGDDGNHKMHSNVNHIYYIYGYMRLAM